jgi:membrane-bound lytic murein transglycosylase MltF
VASYNAGPARVAQLRRKAERMGLDPNKNVEVGVAREIGREPVTCVSNVYKYYVTYDLVVRQREAQEHTRSAVTGQTTVLTRQYPSRGHVHNMLIC